MRASALEKRRLIILDECAKQIIKTFVEAKQRIVVFGGAQTLAEHLARTHGGASRCEQLITLLVDKIMTAINRHMISCEAERVQDPSVCCRTVFMGTGAYSAA